MQQGIYDIALDPDFATNHYYYVFYTLGTPNRDRLSRFTANATNTGTVAGSELVLYQDPQDANAEHHGGAINFGNDGKLYFTTGEHFNAGAAQLLTNPRGQDPPHQQGRHHPDRQPLLRRRWARTWTRSGRSACATRSGRSTTRRPDGFYIGDVGGNDYSTADEEVNLGAARRQLRLAELRGTVLGALHEPALLLPAQRPRRLHHRRVRLPRQPVPGRVPVGSYFFADYAQNWIRRLTFDASGNVSGVFNFEPHRRLGRRPVRRHRLPDARAPTARSTTSTSATPTSAAPSA